MDEEHGIQPRQISDAWIDREEQLKANIIGVSRAKGLELDSYFGFDELSISKLSELERHIILEYSRAAKLYMMASHKNPKSERTYDFRKNIESVRERARNMAITSKAVGGWGIQQVLNNRVRQEILQTNKSEEVKPEKKGIQDLFFKKKQEEEQILR